RLLLADQDPMHLREQAGTLEKQIDDARTGDAKAMLWEDAYRARLTADPLQRVLAQFAGSLQPPIWKRLLQGEPVIFSTKSEEGCARLTVPFEGALAAARPRAGDPGLTIQWDNPAEESRWNQGEASMQRRWASASLVRVYVWLQFRD